MLERIYWNGIKRSRANSVWLHLCEGPSEGTRHRNRKCNGGGNGLGEGHGQLVSRGCGMAAEENEEVLWVDSDAQYITTGLKATEPQAENY